MSDEGSTFWVASPDCATPDHVPGRCSRCGAAIFFSAVCKPPAASLLCERCAHAEMGAEEVAVTEATLEEIGAKLGISADAAFEQFAAVALARFGKPLRRMG
jgi:hypothetical protein